jgi:hypothetical protein
VLRSRKDGTRAWARIGGRSEAGGGHELLGVALAFDLDLGRRALDLGEVIDGQLDVGRAEMVKA